MLIRAVGGGVDSSSFWIGAERSGKSFVKSGGMKSDVGTSKSLLMEGCMGLRGKMS